MASSPDYPILGAPRISVRGFAAVLAGGHSPAAGEAVACYNALVGAGVDPAVGLAIFRKESTFGRFGRAAHNRSWGNIRGAGAGYPIDSGRFRIYPTWSAGAADMARLLVVYGHNRIKAGTRTDTVQTLPYVWAPSSDGNAPDAYGDSLARWIGEWSAKYPASGSGDPTGIPTSSPAPSAGILEEFLATIGRSISDPIRDQDIFPFVQFLQSKGLVPGGDPNNNPLVNAVVLELKALIGHPWSEAGPQFLSDAGHQDPFGISSGLAQLGDAIGSGLIHAVILVGIVLVIGMGLYFVARGEG